MTAPQPYTRLHCSPYFLSGVALSLVALIGLARASSSRADNLPSPTPQTLGKPDALILVEADATRTAAPDPMALRALWSAPGPTPETGQATTSPPPDVAAPPPDAPPSPATALAVWGRLRGKRAPVTVTLPDSAPSAPLAVYASHSAEGATVCLANRSDRKARLRVQIRLPRGIYKIERLTLLRAEGRGLRAEGTSEGERGNREQSIGNRPNPQPSALSPQPFLPKQEASPHIANLERTSGRDLAQTAVVTKFCALEPGQVCLWRYTDEAEAVQQALNETHRRIKALEGSASGPAHRLRRILNEGNLYAGDLRNGRGKGRRQDRRLGRIHRLLLIVAQAQSLHRNYQERKSVPEESGAAVMGALERLSDSLAEASATLLGLVPQIRVEIQQSPAIPAVASSETGTDAPVALTVTISLAHQGQQSVALVKIGQDAAALPPGVTCEPSDPALFGTLHPGQTVWATFHLRYSATADFAANRCVGDISYFTANAPAHLRVRPW